MVGIDISPSMLREAARRARKTGARPSFARADAHDLPFAAASVSGVVCGGTLALFMMKGRLGNVRVLLVVGP